MSDIFNFFFLFCFFCKENMFLLFAGRCCIMFWYFLHFSWCTGVRWRFSSAELCATDPATLYTEKERKIPIRTHKFRGTSRIMLLPTNMWTGTKIGGTVNEWRELAQLNGTARATAQRWGGMMKQPSQMDAYKTVETIAIACGTACGAATFRIIQIAWWFGCENGSCQSHWEKPKRWESQLVLHATRTYSINFDFLKYCCRRRRHHRFQRVSFVLHCNVATFTFRQMGGRTGGRLDCYGLGLVS